VGCVSLGTDNRSKVSLLGGFQLWWSGSEQVGVPRASQRLVAFLAIRGWVASRAVVAGTLWPDATETYACSYLRSALARLNHSCRNMLRVSEQRQTWEARDIPWSPHSRRAEQSGEANWRESISQPGGSGGFRPLTKLAGACSDGPRETSTPSVVNGPWYLLPEYSKSLT